MTLVLGSVPENLSVVLVKDADFFTTLQDEDGPWPVTAEIKLVFSNGTTWDAVITGADAIFNVDSADVNTLIAARPPKVKLMYIDGPAEICWAIGQVETNG